MQKREESDAGAGVSSGYRRPPLVIALSNGAWHEEYLSTPHKRVNNLDRFPSFKESPKARDRESSSLDRLSSIKGSDHPSPKAREPSSFSNLRPESTMTLAKMCRSPSSLSRSPTIKSNIDSLSNLAEASRSYEKSIDLVKEASRNRAILMGDMPFSGSMHSHPAERRFELQVILSPVVVITIPFVWWYVKGSPFYRLTGFRTQEIALWFWFDFLALLIFFTALLVSARLFFPQLSASTSAPPLGVVKAILGQSWGSLSSSLLKPLATMLTDDNKDRRKSSLPITQKSSHAVTWTIGSSNNKPIREQPEKEKLSGEGVQTYSNGDVYEGEFHQGRCSGSGVYYFYMSGRYEGEWVDGKYDGYGVETWARGSRYRGQYRQGLRDGYGVYRFYTGDVYSGEWSNGQSHGCGTQTCEDGSRYRGEFKWGLKHGYGFYHFRNGDTYAGEYFADKMHGYGVYQFANGHRYEGSWHEGRKQGLGIYTFRNGETHAGHWHHGVLETRSSQNPGPNSPTAVYHSKVLNAVQEARRAASKAMDVPRVEDRVNKAVAAANRCANAARVAAVKAVQKRNSVSPSGSLV
ncbi:hypothetical protein R1sor_017821 [Riccia sorocarpa]|uniref:Uncharacterized protein n=1 Tax=Riccia sorocarpa TaxID=122646 RepID=A0ABD3IE71_9MARC